MGVYGMQRVMLYAAVLGFPAISYRQTYFLLEEPHNL